MKHKKDIAFLLIFLWIFLASFNVFYNSVKAISEIQEWGSLSNDQKLKKIFGTSYEFSAFIHKNTTGSADILIYSEEGMPYFYARYYLYPRRVYWYQNEDEYVKSKYPKKFDYVAAYNMNVSPEDYKKVASFSSKYSNVFGSLYKRK